MANKIDVDGGNPYRDSKGRFDDSPFEFLQNRGSKTYVSREDNEKKIKGLKKEAEKQLEQMRKAAANPNDNSTDLQRNYDELEHQKRAKAAADAIANLDGTDEAVATGNIEQLQEVLVENGDSYTRSEIKDAIVLLHQDPYYQQFVLPQYQTQDEEAIDTDSTAQEQQANSDAELEDSTQSKAPGTFKAARTQRVNELKKQAANAKDIDSFLNESVNAYHGTGAKFEEFSYDNMGSNGTDEGYGFYFTKQKEFAERYGANLHEVHLVINKPIPMDKITMSDEELGNFMRGIDPTGEDYLSAWGDVHSEGYEKVVQTAIKNERQYSTSDFDMVHGIINANGHDPKRDFSILNRVTGFDGVVSSSKNDEDLHAIDITVAWSNDQIISKQQLEEIYYSVHKDQKPAQGKKDGSGATKTENKQREDNKKTANAIEHKIDLVVKNQISARDFPHVYEDLGIDLGELGCIMLNTEPIDIQEQIQDLWESGNIYYGDADDSHYGVPAQTEPHVTLLYGLLQNGHVWRDKVNEMLMGWSCPELTVQKVSYFDIGKAFAVIALLKKTPELIDGHDRLTLLPHVNTFSEYVPHVSLVYVDKTVDVDALVKVLNKQLKGATLKTTTLNYGDEPEQETKDSDDYDEPEDTTDYDAAEADEVSQVDSLVEYKPKALQSAANGELEHFLAVQSDGHSHSQDLDKVANSLTEDQQAIQLLEQANLDNAVKNLDKDIVNAVIEQLQKGNLRAAEELITEAQEGAFVNYLVAALVVYGLAMMPLYAMQLLFLRTNGSGIWNGWATDPNDPDYEFSDDLKNATRPSAQSHVRTILSDTTKVINDSYDKEVEAQLQKLIDERLAAQDEGYDRAELYKIARTRAKKGESLQNIIKAVQDASEGISNKRAKVLSRNEQFRIFTMSQFEADRQFLLQTNNGKRAYKKLVSMSGNPCPVCNLIIERTAVNPIPFHKNFANLHDELEAEYIKENGDAGRMKLKLNFAPIESGNVHVNCHCRYQLLLKNDDGTFLNAFEGDQYTLKANNSMDWDPSLHPRDDEGKFKDKVGMHIEDLYKSYPTLEQDAKNLAKLLRAKAKSKDTLRKEDTGTDLWWELFEANGIAEKSYRKELNKAVDNLGIDLDMVNGMHYEWSGGNGPRGEDGYYLATPELQENISNSNILKAQYLTQATLFELGLKKVKVYRGEKVTAKHEARGLVSFSTSKSAAESFGWTSKYVTEKHPHTGEEVQVRERVAPNVIEKEVPITAVLTHHYVLFDTEYETEREVIVDTDKL